MFDLLIRRPSNIKNDVLSGLTVSLALVPEAVAFAFVAGIDPSMGLWAAFIVGFMSAAFGGRPGMISGATGAMAVVMTVFVADYGVEYLFAAVIGCGLIQVLCGLFKVGKFVRLLPHPVMLGFVNGLAIVIGKAQFGQLQTGHQVVYDEKKGGFESVGEWMQGEEMIVTVSLILLTMGIIHFFPKITKMVPGTLVAIVVVTTLVQLSPIESVNVQQFMDSQKKMAKELAYKEKILEEAKPGLKVSEVSGYGHNLAKQDAVVPPSAPSRAAGTFALPSISWDMKSILLVLGLSFTLAAIGLIESLMTLSLIDELTGTRGKGNRECVGQGLGNIISGFLGSMGGCAMIGQSMINIRSGGRGRMSGMAAALFLLCFLLFQPLWYLISVIPVAALIGVMFIVVIATFEWTSLRLWNKIPGADLFVIISVSALTVVYDLAIAVFAGVIISALVFAWRKSLKIRAAVSTEGSRKIYSLSGPLFFGSVNHFKEIFTPDQDPAEVVAEFKNSQVYDHSAIEAIHGVSEKYKTLGKKFTLRHLSPECQQLLEKAGDTIEVHYDEDPEYRVSSDTLG